MKKSTALFLLGAVIQTCGIVVFPAVSASSQAVIAKPVLLLLVAAGLLLLLFKLVRHLEFGQVIWLVVGLAALAVCTHQLLGFLLYPGLIKDVELMSPQHAWLTLMVFVLVMSGYLAGYGLIRLGRRLLHLKNSFRRNPR